MAIMIIFWFGISVPNNKIEHIEFSKMANCIAAAKGIEASKVNGNVNIICVER